MTTQERRWLIRGGLLLVAIWLLVLASVQLQTSQETPTATLIPDIANHEDEQVDIAAVPATPVPDAPQAETGVSEDVAAAPVINPDADVMQTVRTEPVPGVAVLQFQPSASAEDRTAYIASLGATLISEIAALNTVTIQLPDGASAATLPESPLLAKAEPDYYVQAANAVPNDPLYMAQWDMPAINAPAAWAVLPDNAPLVTIAVVDSGICDSHAELAGKIIADGWDFVENDAVPQDAYGHGCAVTGVIAAQHNNRLGIAGVAPNARILPVRVLDDQGVGTYSQVAAGIVYAAEHGAQIINISLGGANPSNMLANAVEFATAQGILIVAAAGNTASPQALYPAAYSDVVAVGAVDPNGEISSFSNYGAAVGLYAPGRDIQTLKLDGGYTTYSGTSLAAPHVSGIAALEMAFGRELVVDGEIVFFHLDNGDEGEITPVPIAECNEDALQTAQAAYFGLIEQGVNGDALREAGQHYLNTAASCFELRYNNGSIIIDGGALQSPGAGVGAQFKPFGTKWGEPPAFNQNFPPAMSGGTVTYSFLPNGVNITGAEITAITTPVAGSIASLPGNTGGCNLEDRIRLAFEAWETVANIQFEEAAEPLPVRPFNAPFEPGLPDIRIGVHPIDGPSNQLGYAYFPSNVPTSDPAYETGTGDIFLDFGENWGCETVFDGAGKVIGLDIGLVALHEIGHAIGLGHEATNRALAVMNPTYAPNLPPTDSTANDYLNLLQRDDKNGARAIYGFPEGEIAVPIITSVGVNGALPIVAFTFEQDAQLFQVQIAESSDTSFATPVRDEMITTTEFTTTTPLPNGSYLVRVRAYNGGWGEFSSIAAFTIETGVPLPVAPSKGDAVFNGLITFGWLDEGAASTTEYEIEIATRAEFVDDNFLVVRQDNILGNTVDITLDAGSYFWRVRREGDTFSNPYNFTVLAERPENLSVSIESGNLVTFSWLPVAGAVEYEFQMDMSENFVGLLFLDKLFLDKLFLDKLFLDKLFLDKLFLDKLSADELFLDKLFLDKLFLDKLFLDKLFLDKLFLDKLFLDKLFLDKLFLDKLFLDKLFLDKLQGTSFVGSLPVSDGTHYWRVRAVYADGTRGPWSEIDEFTIDTRDNNVVINEIKVSDPSWIEIYNADNTLVDLTGWQFVAHNAAGEATLVYDFPDGTVMQPGDYLVLYEADGTDTDTALYLGSSTIDWGVIEGEAEPEALVSVAAPNGIPVSQTVALSSDVSISDDVRVMNAPANDDEQATAQFTITVTTTSEETPGCTLADAITAANTDTTTGDCPAGSGADVIELGSGETYVLTESLANITSDITINGNGSTILRDADAPDFAIFTVVDSSQFILNDLTLSGGAGGVGGNMSMDGNSTVTINNSTLKNGSSTNGGGIYTTANTTLYLNNSTISNNSTYANDGGGLFLGGTATIINSTISGNHANDLGGGIVTSAGNFNTINVINTTITQNSAGSYGAGLYNFNGAVNVKNSIIADQAGGVNCAGTITSSGVNFADDDTCSGFTETATPLIETTLADNGGTTQTHALVDGSPAKDAALDCTDLSANPVTTDQRGVNRPQGAACDAGAVERLAGDLTVTTTDMTEDGDDGLCSLKEAVIAANDDAASGLAEGECVPSNGADTIILDGDSTYTLTESIYGEAGPGLPNISSNITIQGNGATIQRVSEVDFPLIEVSNDGSLTLDNVTLSGGDASYGGAIYNNGNLTIQNNSVITGNNATYNGGGIYNAGNLTITDSTISDNTADNGAGIYSEGVLTILRSVVDDNHAENSGGGIWAYNYYGEDFQVSDNAVSAADYDNYAVVITDSVISGNTAANGGGMQVTHDTALVRTTITNNAAAFSGGGIYQDGFYTLMLDRSVIQNNSAGDDGGGIYTYGGYLKVLARSVISNNTALGTGGGFYSEADITTIDRSTIADNQAGADGGGFYSFYELVVNRSAIVGNQAGADGGAAYIDSDGENYAEIVNTTISANSAGDTGDGIYSDSPLYITNTTIAFHDGTGIYAAALSTNVFASIFANTGTNCDTGLGGTLNVYEDSLSTDATCGDATIGDPLLGSLTGSPVYHPLGVGSDALDIGNDEICAEIDQRGIARPQGEACDAGAIESTQVAAPVPVIGTIGGTARLLQGSTVVDLVRFGDTTLDVENTSVFTGGNVAMPEDDETIGRDPYSSDTNHVTDWTRQAETLGGQNFVRLKINEVNPGTTDYVEIVNPGFDSVDMTGWKLKMYNASGSLEIEYTFPVDFMIAPLGYVTVYEGSGANTATKLYIGQGISWADFNAAGAVSLTNGSYAVDFVRFGDSGVNALSLANLQPEPGTNWFGPGALPPLPSQSLGRDSESTDTDTANDWSTQSTSASLVNAVAPAPPNDEFIDAFAIDSIPFRSSQPTLEATVTEDDPVPSCGVDVGRTVWYAYTATSSQSIRIQTDGSDFDTVLAVWTYNGVDFTEVVCDNDSSEGARSLLDINANAGTTYYIQVGGQVGDGGSLVLSLQPPDNDDFDNALPVNALPYSNTQQTLAATLLAEDPIPSCVSSYDRTVWYEFTPTSSDVVRFTTANSDYDTGVAVYTGSRFDLTEVACSDDEGQESTSSLLFSPVAGMTYYIMVTGNQDESGTLVFEVETVEAPANDPLTGVINFTLTVPEPLFTHEENTDGAQTTGNEPTQSCGLNNSKSVWFSYTPSLDGIVVLQSISADYDTVLSVYAGAPNSASTDIACNDDVDANQTVLDGVSAAVGVGSRVILDASIGTTYYIQVSGRMGESGNLVFDAFLPDTTPPNDERENAFDVAALPYEFDQVTTGATVSPADALLLPSCGADVGKTVWYKYIPTAGNAYLEFTTNGSDFDTVMAVFKEVDGDLIEVACDDDGGEGTQSLIRTTTGTNTPLYIVIGGYQGASGNLDFNVVALNRPPVVDNPGDQFGLAGQPIAPLPINARDEDNDTLTYSAAGLPPGVTINPQTGVISGVPGGVISANLAFANADLPLVYNVTVTVNDGNGGIAKTQFKWALTQPQQTLSVTSFTLVNADNGTDIMPITNNLIIFESDLPTTNISIRANTSGSPASVRFALNGNVNFGTDNAAPFAIAGNTGADYNAWAYVIGQQYQLTASPFTGSDAAGVTGVSLTVNFTIQDVPNQPPTVTNPGTQTNTSGDAVNLPIVATDPENQDLTYEATGLPGGLSINADTGVISGTIDANAHENSPYSVTVTATDPGDLSDSETFTWIVNAPVVPNQPPTVTNPGTQTNTSGDAVNVPIVATDPENQDLTYEATGLPGGLSINADTGVISGTIDANAHENSPYSVTVTATDPGDLSDSETFTWIVNEPEPLCVELDPLTHLSASIIPGNIAGQWVGVINNNSDCLYDVALVAYQKVDEVLANQILFDDGGTATALQIGRGETRLTITAPECAAQVDVVFDASHLGVYPAYAGAQAQLDIVPLILPEFESNQYGLYGNRYDTRLIAVKHLAGDYCGAGEENPPQNLPPVVTNPGTQTNTSGDAVNLPIVANDPENQTLTYSATGLPGGLSINQDTGVISGNIAANAHTNSPYSVTVSVLDDGGLTDSETFSWIVNAPAPQNQPPTVTNPGTQTNTSGNSVNLPIVANDPENQTLTYSATGLPGGLSINQDTGVISGNIAANAHTNSPYSVTVSVLDDGGLTDSETFSWIVNAPVVPNQPPTVTNPGTQTNTSGNSVNLPIVGNDPENKPLRYSASGLPGGLTINDSTGIISGIIAANAHTGSPYSVTVSVLDDGGLTDSETFSWIVNAPAPVCSQLDPYAHLTVQIIPGASPQQWVAVFNNSSVCNYEVGFAAYYKFDAIQSNQALFSPDGVATAVIGAGETRLTITAPQCATQLDAFFDASHLGVYPAYAGKQAELDIVPLVLPAFATEQFGRYGNWYGPRLLTFKHVWGAYCAPLTPAPENVTDEVPANAQSIAPADAAPAADASAAATTPETVVTTVPAATATTEVPAAETTPEANPADSGDTAQ